MLRLAAMMDEGEHRFVERKPWVDSEVEDEPLAADAMVLDEHGNVITPEAWRRSRGG